MKIINKIIIAISLLLVSACSGGGSAGTGTSSGLTIQGRVLDTSSAPVANALVIVKETGDRDTSDQEGNFLIETMAVSGELTLEVTSEGKTNTTTITVNEGDSTLQITVKINPLLENAEASQLEVNAKIVGECDSYFENFKPIRQSNPVPGPLTCLAKVRVESGGTPLAHVPIAIQYRGCSTKSDWHTIALGATLSGSNLGVAQVSFAFSDDPEHCLYRILAPFDSKNIRPVIFEIQTFSYQNSE